MECIADEELMRFSRDNVFAHVSIIAEGMGYYAVALFPNSPYGSSEIALFSKKQFENTLAPEMLHLLYTPDDLKKTTLIRIYSNDSWQTIGYHPGFTPREVGTAIMRGLLRSAGERERADVWQPLEGTSGARLFPLLQPLRLKWRISELKRWVEDYRSDNNSDILLFHSEAKGYIDIYNEYPFPLVGMRCEQPINGAIELVPYILEGATPGAVAKLQSWRDALEASQVAELIPEELRQIRDILADFTEFENAGNRGTLLHLAGIKYAAAHVDLTGARYDVAGRLVVFLADQGAGAAPPTPLGRLLGYLAAAQTLPIAKRNALQAIIDRYHQ